MATNRLLPLVCMLVCGSARSHEAASPALCQSAGTQPPIASAKAGLDADVTDLHARLKLADAWSDAGCFNEALQILQAGEAMHPHDKELQTRLQVAKSVVSEQSYFDNMDRAARDAKLSRAMFRCSNLAELVSCDDALSMKPDDAELLVAKADTLVQLKRPGEALGIYRSALARSGNRDAVNAKIQLAVAQRRAFLDSCESNAGEVALRACESAWLPGSPDEVALLKRRGLLLQAGNQLSSALDAYMAAARLEPGDRGVALAIIGLSDSTERRDALSLAARGFAFMTLSRPAEAIAPLRAALRLTPDLTDAKAQLRIAEKAAREQRPERAAVDPAAAAAAAAAPAVASASDHGARTYSNDAPVTRSN